VASLGTALTEDQVYLLNRFSSNTVMLYDGDPAGIKAAVRGGLVCLAKGMHVRLAILPEHEDPDTFILNRGAKALSDLIDAAPDLIAFIAESDNLGIPAKERIEQILDALRLLSDPIQKELFLKEVSASFGVSQNALLSKLKLSSSRALSSSSPQVSQAALSDDPQERFLLWAALKDRQSYNLLANELSADYFNNKLYRSLYVFLQKRLQNQEGFDPAALLDDIDNNEIKECLAELLFEDLQQTSISGLIKDLKLRKLKRDLDHLDKAINGDPENLDLLKEKDKLSREYRRLTKRVVNKVLY
jgi:DNA primase